MTTLEFETLDPLAVKAELLQQADDDRERAFEVARRAFEERSDAILGELSTDDRMRVVQMAFGDAKLFTEIERDE